MFPNYGGGGAGTGGAGLGSTLAARVQMSPLAWLAAAVIVGYWVGSRHKLV